MKRELLVLVNIAAFILTVLLFCTVQSVLLHTRILSWMHIDLILILVVYLSANRPPVSGGVLTIVASRIVEIHSGAPTGLLMVSYYGLFLSIVFVREIFLVRGSSSSFVLCLLGGVIWKIFFAVTAASIGVFSNLWLPFLQYMVPSLVSIALLSGPIFRFLQWLDQLTQPDQSQTVIV